jgi:hypothetical protein
VDFSTLNMDVIRSSETSVDTKSTRRHVPEDGNLHSHRCESFKSYTMLIMIVFTLTILARVHYISDKLVVAKLAKVLSAALSVSRIFSVDGRIIADQSGRTVSGTNCLRSLEVWDRGFESHSRHGCLYAFILFVLFCV